MQAALSAQAAASEQKDAASESHQREARKAQERESRLAERVEILERLQETARRTVLGREERLRQAEARLASTTTERATLGIHHEGDDRGHERGEMATAAPTKSGSAGAGERRADGPGRSEGRPLAATVVRSAEKDVEAFFGAQEWWLHLAAVEKRGRRRDGTGDEVHGGEGVASRGNEGKTKETRRLRRLLEEQGLEVVTLRQRVLKAEMALRAKAGEAEERRAADRRRVLASESSLRVHKSAESAHVAELEERVATLRSSGDMHQALARAREEMAGVKLSLMRAEGDAGLHAQLLVRFGCDVLYTLQ